MGLCECGFVTNKPIGNQEKEEETPYYGHNNTVRYKKRNAQLCLVRCEHFNESRVPHARSFGVNLDVAQRHNPSLASILALDNDPLVVIGIDTDVKEPLAPRRAELVRAGPSIRELCDAEPERS